MSCEKNIPLQKVEITTMYSYSCKTTTYTYDKANQLVSSTTDGKVTPYAYDAAGRLIKEGDKSYSYGWLDKVLSVTENGKPIASFNYHNDGQIAQAIHNGKSEDFLWDGLALIHRGETWYYKHPHKKYQGLIFLPMGK